MNEILDDLEEELEDEEDGGGQPKNKRNEHLRPWMYKKGQSGNPNGRPHGISLKEYARKKFRTMTDEEREEFFNGMDKKTLWEMAEGKPEAKVEHSGKITTEVSSMSDEELRRLASGGEEGTGEA